MKEKAAGIYIHVPFCIKRCRYCDFFSSTDLGQMDAYARALTTEIELAPSKSLCFDTIYFGGGTPSLLPVQHITTVLDTLFARFSFPETVEITLEANPQTLTSGYLAGIRKAGINRLHLGVQSFSDDFLRFLGRIHSGSEAEAAIALIRKSGFENMGMDLIYGLPGQTRRQWEDTLKKAVSHAPEHLSCYMLTYEPGTVLDMQRQAHRFDPLTEDTAADLFALTADLLAENGYFQYEISNFARIRHSSGNPPDTRFYRSRHNTKYWTFAPYLGFGPSAHSFEPPVRYWNTADLGIYLDRMATHQSPMEDNEVLNATQRLIETVSLGLRTAEGIDITQFRTDFKRSFAQAFSPASDILVGGGLLRISDGRATVTATGKVLLNKITEMLVNCL